jgi:6-pyruvoyltetrahydropterin/6-carboxytetrahydropterin synthase
MFSMSSYIYIDGWKTNITFSSAHIIPEYEKCGRLHGHTYAIHAKIYGVPDEKGIIVDFSVLKKTLREVVGELDHKVLIPEKSTWVTIEKEQDIIFLNSFGKKYSFPVEDCVLLPFDSTSAENLARYLLSKVDEHLASFLQVEKIEIGVDEGFGQGARVVQSRKETL